MATAKGARSAAVWGTGLLLDNQPKVLGELEQGYNAGQTFLGQAGNLYKGMADQGVGAVNAYNALTLGDPSSVSAAVQADPRYAANYDPGMQALLRARSAGGMLNSGNTDTDAMSFAANLGNATYGQMLQDKLPMIDLYKTGTTGQAGVLGSQAGLATDYFGNRASVLDNTTKSIVGLGTEAFKAGDAAKNANQANAINIGMGIGKMALSAFGGPAGIASGIGSGFTSLGG